MPSEWREMRLGEVCSFRAGSVFGLDFQGEERGDYPFIKVSDMNLPANERRINEANNWVSDANRRRLGAIVHPAGATVFAKIGVALTYNRRRMLVRDTIIDNNMMSAVPNAGYVEPEFLYYLLRTLDFNEIVSGTALPFLAVRDLALLEVALPELERQRAIARILGALDDKIELNRRMNKTLEQTARAIFKSWFVDFEPFRDKGMVDSELGKVPKGWKAGTVADVAEFNAWTLRDTDKLGRIEYIEISEVTRGDVMNVQEFTRGTEPSRARRRLRHGDTVLSTVRPERESYFLCLNPPANLIASTGFAVFTPTSAPWSFVHAALTRPNVFEHLGSQADGGAYPSVHAEVIAAWPIPLPPATILDEFQRICAPLYRRAVHNRTESRTLAAIRDALLPKLMSGEVRVEEV